MTATRQTSPSPISTRLLIDDPADAAWNMAVDQALLQSAEQRGTTTLRFYQWSRPSLSLGYFQPHDDRRRHLPSASCELVRRKTGGGAILHHHELTYSLTLPAGNRWASENEELYDRVHRVIIDVLAGYGVSCQRYADTVEATSGTPADNSEFLCFLRRSDGDLVAGTHKIVGSAQRRLKHSLLQHGSILLARSEFAPELAGIHDLVGETIPRLEFREKLADRMGARLQLRLAPGRLSTGELADIHSLSESTFANPTWNLRR